MKQRLLITSLLLAGMAGQAWADGYSSWADGGARKWVGALALGPVWASEGETQTFYLTPAVERTFVADNSSKALAAGELFLGMEKAVSERVVSQMGVVFASTSRTTLHGIIWDDADPQFDNFSYQYKLQNNHVGLKARFLYDSGSSFMPWVSASVGLAFNHAYDYTNTPLIFEAVASPNFSDRTQIGVSYSLGIGIQKVINDNWQVGVGYEFADWGKSQLGAAYGQTMNSGLKLNHFKTNGLMVNATWAL